MEQHTGMNVILDKLAIGKCGKPITPSCVCFVWGIFIYQNVCCGRIQVVMLPYALASANGSNHLGGIVAYHFLTEYPYSRRLWSALYPRCAPHNNYVGLFAQMELKAIVEDIKSVLLVHILLQLFESICMWFVNLGWYPKRTQRISDVDKNVLIGYTT